MSNDTPERDEAKRHAPDSADARPSLKRGVLTHSSQYGQVEHDPELGFATAHEVE